MSETIEAAPETRILGPDALFLVWGPPSHGPRSQVFARELGIEIRFITSFRRRGAIVAPFKYLSMAAKTVRLLAARRPRVVFVQSPPTIAVATVWAFAVLTGARFFIDTHSAAMLSSYWTRPAWLHRLIARRAAATIVTNQYFARRIREQGGTALVIPDIPTSFRIGEPFEVEGNFTVMVVNSFAPDEPLSEIVAAARELPGVSFYVTGDPNRAGEAIPRPLPVNVRLTGFLPDPTYYALMASCQAVMCLTTRDHTMQRGACEALWMSTPIVTSRWPLLQEYFSSGTVHVAENTTEIRDGIQRMVREYEEYQVGIRRLAAERRRGWWDAIASLVSLVEAPARDPATSVLRRRARRSG
ncbi:MAG TPA: glycosyltransferase [Actinomycetota bacterium]|nr:glycosyltransferase [Actinomycetota bacterium]